jgi:hypothetical protein
MTVVITLIATLAVAVFFFVVTITWYRIKYKYHDPPPTYNELLKMSTISDSDDIRQDNKDAYESASQERYYNNITHKELRDLNTSDD